MVRARVGLVDGGLGINCEYLGLSREQFKEFLHELLAAMRFDPPQAVHIERNARERRVNWNRLRISAEECRLFGVRPPEAVERARAYLTSDQPKRFGLIFRVSEPVQV